MVGTGALGVARREVRNVNQRQAMMLVIVTEKAQPLVAKDDTRREHRPIPLGHFVQLPGAQHEWANFAGLIATCDSCRTLTVKSFIRSFWAFNDASSMIWRAVHRDFNVRLADPPHKRPIAAARSPGSVGFMFSIFSTDGETCLFLILY